MRELIERRFPEHGIIGEEFGRVREDAEFVWVLGSDRRDQILYQRGAAVRHPDRTDPSPAVRCSASSTSRSLGERWVGAAGRPTTLNGARDPVAGPARHSATATLFATTPDMFRGPKMPPRFARVSAAVKLTRFGADCYAYGLLAAGFVDLVLEASLKPYDFCAMIPIVEGAGGDRHRLARSKAGPWLLTAASLLPAIAARMQAALALLDG